MIDVKDVIIIASFLMTFAVFSGIKCSKRMRVQGVNNYS